MNRLSAMLQALRLQPRTAGGTQLGLWVAPQRFALAHIQLHDSTPRLLAGAHEAFTHLADFSARLRSVINTRGWHGQDCRVVLSSQLYRLHQADAPQVPENERNAALGFALRDVIDYPASEAALDAFPLPAVAARGGQERVFVAVSHRPHLQPFAHEIFHAGLKLQSIDIPELSCRDLLQRLPDRPQSAALLRPTSRGATLYVYHGEDLVVSRTLSGLNDLEQIFASDLRNQQEQLLLEVQRTLDYYESQIGRRPVARLYLPPLTQTLQALPELLTSNLGVPVATLDLAKLLAAPDTLSPDECADIWLAASAGLRTEVPHAAH